MTTGVDSGERTRQRREEVKARLRESLQELAADQSFRDIKVADLTSRAGLSRSAFYFYYDDKRDLLIETVKRISEEIFDLSRNHFEQQSEPREVVHAVLRANAEAWGRHADLLRLTVEASMSDEHVQRYWRAIITSFIAAVEARMRSDQQRELVPADLDAATYAEVLVTATEGFFYRQISRQVMSPDEAVTALEPIWLRLLYL